MSENPLLSVVMITYGHEKYIEEAIRGVFLQKTNFLVEFIISNDSSPDKTDEIIKKLIPEAPENIKVKYTNHEKNLGMMPNFVWALEQAKGKYIALCEGDDYWTNPQKLQIQVNFLEENSVCALAFHGCVVKLEDNIKEKHIPFQDLKTGYYTDQDLLTSWLIPTASAVFVKSKVNNALSRLKNSKYFFGDIVLFLSLSLEGRVYGIQEKMSVYRINTSGATKKDGINQKYEKIAAHYVALSDDFGMKYKQHFKPKIKTIYINLFKYNLKRFNIHAIKYAVKLIFDNY